MNFNWKTQYYRYHRYFFNLQKATKTEKVRSFAWLSLSIFTVAFFVLVAIRPTLITIAKLNREIKDKKEASQELQKKINSIIAAQQEYAKNIDYLPLLDEALPQKSDFPRLASFFEQSASNSGITLASLTFEKIEVALPTSGSQSNRSTHSLAFQLSITGAYPQLKNFLQNLQSSRRILMIEGVYFNQVKKEGEKRLTLQVSGHASFLKPL